MNKNTIVHAVINPLDNTLCGVWRKKKDANNDAIHSRITYMAERYVHSGTISEIMELTNSTYEQITKAL